MPHISWLDESFASKKGSHKNGRKHFSLIFVAVPIQKFLSTPYFFVRRSFPYKNKLEYISSHTKFIFFLLYLHTHLHLSFSLSTARWNKMKKNVTYHIQLKNQTNLFFIYSKRWSLYVVFVLFWMFIVFCGCWWCYVCVILAWEQQNFHRQPRTQWVSEWINYIFNQWRKWLESEWEVCRVESTTYKFIEFHHHHHQPHFKLIVEK